MHEKKINIKDKLGWGLVWTYQDCSRKKKRCTGLVLSVILQGKVAFQEYRPDKQVGVVLSAISSEADVSLDCCCPHRRQQN